MLPIDIRPIASADTHALRHSLLRPHRTLAEMDYPGDNAPETLHLGAFLGDRHVGIASIYREAPPDTSDSGAFRLRGMATLPELRGAGVGGHLLDACLAAARDAGGSYFWCNARVRAEAFYRRHGLEPRGAVFELPGFGPHVFMDTKLVR